MATFFDRITAEQRALLEAAPVFFVATCDPLLGTGPDGQGPLNLSPKGATSPLLLDDRTVAWLDYVGSGDETARHVAAGSPCTLMAMSTSAVDAAIVRLYGRAELVGLDESPHAAALVAASRMQTLVRPRRVFVLHVERTMTSCGYGVPVAEPWDDRPPDARGRRFKPARPPG